jgi:peroxiredoxin Q/BCP
VTDRLQPGDKAPAFTLTDDTGQQVSLADFAGRKVIVYFYSLTKDGYAVVGISPDKPEKLAKFRDKDGLTITLLSDPDKSVMQEWAAFGEKMMYGKKVTGVIRSTFVVDEDGTIEHAWYNVKATGHVAKLRRDLGLQ